MPTPKMGSLLFFIEIYERKRTMKFLITMLLNKKCKKYMFTYVYMQIRTLSCSFDFKQGVFFVLFTDQLRSKCYLRSWPSYFSGCFESRPILKVGRFPGCTMTASKRNSLLFYQDIEDNSLKEFRFRLYSFLPTITSKTYSCCVAMKYEIDTWLCSAREVSLKEHLTVKQRLVIRSFFTL